MAPTPKERPYRQRQADHRGTTAGAWQRAHMGHDGGEVGIGESVVVFAGHHHGRLSGPLHAVAGHAGPVFRRVGQCHAAGAAVDGGVGELEAIAIVDERSAGAVGAVAVAAAARGIEVGAALACSGIAGEGRCGRQARQDHAALAQLIAAPHKRGHGRGPDHHQAGQGDEQLLHHDL